MLDENARLLVAETGLLSFYGWWQLTVCAFAFVGLMAIWWHIGRRQEDTGQVWLALSVLCWSISGGVEVIFVNFLPHAPAYLLDGWRSILSLGNSLFILMGLPWFRYLPQRIEPIINSRYWPYIIGLPFLFSLLPTISKMISGKSITLISELDVYYSILTLIFLGLVLWESFAKRRLIMLAWLSLVCILITFLAQVYKFTGSNVNMTLFSAIFKTSLIMIFFALALSWVKELSENVIPDAAHLALVFDEKTGANGKKSRFVRINGIPGKPNAEVPLTPALYSLLLTFARQKKKGEGWLEIKPKSESRPEKNYDIQDHNEVRRLLHALLDGIFGKGNWTKNLHEQPLRHALFEMSEKRERKIRLALPASNVALLGITR